MVDRRLRNGVVAFALAAAACGEAPPAAVPVAPSAEIAEPEPEKPPAPVEDPDLPKAREILTDLARWDAATPEERNAAAAVVDRRLEDFRRQAIKTFECGGQRHEIAIFIHEKTGMEMCLLPGGTLVMGSPGTEQGRDDDEVQHQVVLSHPFLIGRTEVTNQQYGHFLAIDPEFPRPKHDAARAFNRADRPVVGISWENVQGYCDWSGLVLLTEAQWEYACRAGTTTPYHYGSDPGDLHHYAWYDINALDKTHPVQGKKPNAFGLFDMHGNVWEWVHDWYGPYPTTAVTDPTGPSYAAKYRVARGGSWHFHARGCRTAYRGKHGPRTRSSIRGFRAAWPVLLR